MTRKLGLEAQVCPEKTGTEKLEQGQENNSRDEHCIDIVETYIANEKGLYTPALDDFSGIGLSPESIGLSHETKTGTGYEIKQDTGTCLSWAVNSSVDPSQDGEILNVASTSKDDDDADKCGLAVIIPTTIKDENDTIPRCASDFSMDSTTECCRICQQYSEEPLIELGCHCRGELARAHRTCIQQWFGNKGSNKCEICQQIAQNVPAPATQSVPHFWVWRLGINRGNGILRRRPGTRFHPLWAALLILIAGLLFDVLISVFLGASALPVNIIIGVLVVLGIGTAARLVVECWHERGLRRNIRRMETNFVQLQNDGMHGATIIQAQSHFVLQPSGLMRPLP